MNDEESVDYIKSNGDANNVNDKNSNHSDKTVILNVAILQDSNDHKYEP